MLNALEVSNVSDVSFRFWDEACAGLTRNESSWKIGLNDQECFKKVQSFDVSDGNKS